MPREFTPKEPRTLLPNLIRMPTRTKEEEERRGRRRKKKVKKTKGYITEPTVWEQLVAPVRRGQRARVKIRGFEVFRFR